MSREVRRVPKDWKHPRNEHGRYTALHEDYKGSVDDWDKGAALWNSGVYPEYASEENKKLSYAEWDMQRPEKEDYMPEWKDGEATHFMMYETCSEGTPISPAFETPEELAKWLFENQASAFGSQTASYESWLRVANGGYACSAIHENGIIKSGVEGLSDA